MQGCDMIVNLTNLPTTIIPKGIEIKKAFVGDKEFILDFVNNNFKRSWVFEVEKAILENKCFIATKDNKICGFSCYDVSAKGFFGPIGIESEKRNLGIGKSLLLKTLENMHYDGYGYAIIGWVSKAEHFYRKTVNAEFIAGGEPENSVFSNIIDLSIHKGPEKKG